MRVRRVDNDLDFRLGTERTLDATAELKLQQLHSARRPRGPWRHAPCRHVNPKNSR
jgi:hypothetical protein